MSEEIRKELLSPCGLYCGVCGIRFAHVEQDQKLKESLARVYGLSPEDIQCEGCLSSVVFKFCRICALKKCAGEKGYEGCHQCVDFPCAHVQNYPWPEAKTMILEAIPRWREMGTRQWVEAEEERYRCPHCNALLFRGVKTCRKCRQKMERK